MYRLMASRLRNWHAVPVPSVPAGGGAEDGPRGGDGGFGLGGPHAAVLQDDHALRPVVPGIVNRCNGSRARDHFREPAEALTATSIFPALGSQARVGIPPVPLRCRSTTGIPGIVVATFPPYTVVLTPGVTMGAPGPRLLARRHSDSSAARRCGSLGPYQRPVVVGALAQPARRTRPARSNTGRMCVPSQHRVLGALARSRDREPRGLLQCLAETAQLIQRRPHPDQREPLHPKFAVLDRDDEPNDADLLFSPPVTIS